MVQKKILIVVSNYYKEVSDLLIEGATKHLRGYGFEISILYTSGCFEIPFLINIKEDKFDGFIALGCIIRGETYHFELISNEVTRKIMDLSIKIKKPIGFGILTCDNLKQALKRGDPTLLNKGSEAAEACRHLLTPIDVISFYNHQDE